jgi:putative oxidoreductase
MFRYLRQPHVDLAKSILRITLGFTFFAHGYIKLFQTYHEQSWTDIVSLSMQQVVGWTEFVCGILLVLGLLSRFAAALLICDMIGAIALVTGRKEFIPIIIGPHGFTFKVGFEYNIMIIAVCTALILVGSGWFSLDHFFFHRFRVGKNTQTTMANPPLRETELSTPVRTGP